MTMLYTKSVLKKRKKIIMVPFLAILIILSAYLLQKASRDSFDRGEFQQSKLRYEKAISSYEKAALLWPFIKTDPAFQEHLSSTKAALENKGTILFTIFFNEDATESEVQGLAEELREHEEIKTVDVISQEEALKRYQEEKKDSPLELEYVTKDILPVSIEVYTSTVQSESYQEKMATLVKSNAFVLDVDKPDEIFD